MRLKIQLLFDQNDFAKVASQQPDNQSRENRLFIYQKKGILRERLAKAGRNVVH